MATVTPETPERGEVRVGTDIPFYASFGAIGGIYIVMIVAMLVAEATYTSPGHLLSALASKEVQYSIRLSLLTCTVTMILALWVSVPIGYLMSRHTFPGKTFVDATLDIPIVLPPLVIGLCLLILFSSPFAELIEGRFHQLERLIANNLVPLAYLPVMLAVWAGGYYVARKLIPSRRLRILVPASICVFLFPALTHRYLFPSLPEWFRVPETFELVDVTYCDQSPLWPSRQVYRANYTCYATAEDVLSTLKTCLSGGGFADLEVVATKSANGKEEGDHHLSVRLGTDVDPRFPHGGDVRFHISPEKPIARLDELQRELDNLQKTSDPIRTEFEKLRTKLAVQEEIDAIREKLDTIRTDWKTDAIRKGIDASEENLEAIEKQVVAVGDAMDAMRQGRNVRAFRSRLAAIQSEMAVVQKKRDALRSRWRTEPVRWFIQGEVLRPAKRFREAFLPRLTIPVTYEIPSIILAQFMVACAFAVRTMRVTFDQIHPRFEQVALTLGCSRGQAFWLVVFPQSWRGLVAAGTLAWARSLGEFGPILIFSGATRMKTEVLPTTVFLEMTVGNIEGAVAASLIMVVSAMIVLVIARLVGLGRMAL